MGSGESKEVTSECIDVPSDTLATGDSDSEDTVMNLSDRAITIVNRYCLLQERLIKQSSIIVTPDNLSMVLDRAEQLMDQFDEEHPESECQSAPEASGSQLRETDISLNNLDTITNGVTDLLKTTLEKVIARSENLLELDSRAAALSRGAAEFEKGQYIVPEWRSRLSSLKPR